jgi:hypothetical protein
MQINILVATFNPGMVLIAQMSQYRAMVTKRPK